jgi:hypothetical protein
MSAAGASMLARKIKKFCNDAGSEIEVAVIPAGITDSGDPIFAIGSSLRNSLPVVKGKLKALPH